jgi:hypothetical protein
MSPDVLSTIPGNTLATAVLTLPDAGSSDEDMVRRVVNMPRRRARGNHVHTA